MREYAVCHVCGPPRRRPRAWPFSSSRPLAPVASGSRSKNQAARQHCLCSRAQNCAFARVGSNPGGTTSCRACEEWWWTVSSDMRIAEAASVLDSPYANRTSSSAWRRGTPGTWCRVNEVLRSCGFRELAGKTRPRFAHLLSGLRDRDSTQGCGKSRNAM